MSIRKLTALTAVALILLAACSASPGASAGGSGAAGCLVGASYNDYDQERWAKADEPKMKAAIEAGGGTYTRTDAKKSSEQQLTDIDNLIGQGVKVILLLSKDTDVIKPALDRADDAGVKVIAYDRLVEDSREFYMSFDNPTVGKVIAETIKGLVPSGNYAIIKGDPTDANAQFLRDGMTAAGIPALGETKDGITVVFEQNTADWSTEGARTNMETALNENNNDIQAVLAENDGMATGAIEALKAVGVTAAVGGQDGDKAALNRVALGTQAVSVWKNAYALGTLGGSVAIQMCNGTEFADIKAPSDLPAGAAPSDLDAHEFTTPDGNKLWSIILNPTPVTQDNVGDPIDAGWITKEDACKDVDAATTTVEACK
jgi:D-xylose transport system substrate-binding protein